MSNLPSSVALTLWAPNLLEPSRVHAAKEALKQRKLPALNILLARAGRHYHQSRAFEAQACYLFHQPQPLPSAPLLAAALLPDSFSQDSNAFWIAVNPVQMLPDRDTLLLFPPEELAIREPESLALLQAFNQHFAQDKIALLYAQPEQWFMQIAQPIDLQSTPLNQVAYQAVTHAYPRGNAAPYWRKLLNESQMLFYRHPVNEQRRQLAQPEINSIWPWGEGRLASAQIHLRSQARIYSDNPYLQGLAKVTSAQAFARLSRFAEWYQPAGHSLIHLAESKSLELETWLVSLEQFEKDWAQPLLEALSAGQIDSVLLDLGASHSYYLTKAKLKRFWRWSRHWSKCV
ncbi:MAG: hypothetical protein JXR44_01715 [Thiotrichales bacterium]|nr:hypothetical protein [Thiotrichales bacterium]